MEKLPAAPTEVRPVADAGGRGHMPPRSPRPNFAVAKVCGIQAGAAQRLQRWGVQITASEASRKIFLLYPPKGGTNIILRHPTGGTKSLQKLPVG